MSDQSLHARFRALYALRNWLEKRGLIDRNPIRGVEEPKVVEKPVDHVTFEEYSFFIASITGEAWIDHRDRLIVSIFFWSGLRVSELCALDLDDIILDRMVMIVRHGKGGKARIVPISPEVPALLNSYLWARPRWYGPDLLLGNDGANGRLGVSGCRNLHPHLWRHGFGTTMLNAGADKAWVQSVMGHSDAKTTDRYAKWLDKGLRRQFNEVHGRIIHNT